MFELMLLFIVSSQGMPEDKTEKLLEPVSEHVLETKSLIAVLQTVTSTPVEDQNTVQDRKEDSISEWDSDVSEICLIPLIAVEIKKYGL